RLSHISFEWTKANTSPETKRGLGELPFRLDVRPSGGHATGATLTLVHGTPVLNTVYWTEDRPADFCRKMAALAGLKAGDVIAFGHTHKPWHRAVDGIHFVNTGSVGRPKDGDPHACYVTVELGGGEPAVEVVRVEYDVEGAARGVIEAGLPDSLAAHLRAGGRAGDEVTSTLPGRP
ncbi:MAG: metallophosphoesterase family protein, partial [Gemmatimonadaceae bacterium]